MNPQLERRVQSKKKKETEHRINRETVITNIFSIFLSSVVKNTYLKASRYRYRCFSENVFRYRYEYIFSKTYTDIYWVLQNIYIDTRYYSLQVNND